MSKRHHRQSKVGVPPLHRARIEAELRGMIERWKAAGCPLDNEVKHSMTPWARTIGGILMVSGFKDFLGNCGTRKTVDDPVQEALAILGVAKRDKPLRPTEWAKIIVDQGLAKTLLPPNERDTEKSRTRAAGVLLSKHLEEEFRGHTDTDFYHLRLEGGCRRWVTVRTRMSGTCSRSSAGTPCRSISQFALTAILPQHETPHVRKRTLRCSCLPVFLATATLDGREYALCVYHRVLLAAQAAAQSPRIGLGLPISMRQESAHVALPTIPVRSLPITVAEYCMRMTSDALPRYAEASIWNWHSYAKTRPQ